MVRARDALYGPDEVAIPIGDLGAEALGPLPNAGQRHGLRIIVDTETVGLAVRRGGHVRPINAGVLLQAAGEALDAGVLRVGHVGKENREVELNAIGHCCFQISDRDRSKVEVRLGGLRRAR
jgi:hypothetical protein